MCPCPCPCPSSQSIRTQQVAHCIFSHATSSSSISYSTRITLRRAKQTLLTFSALPLLRLHNTTVPSLSIPYKKAYPLNRLTINSNLTYCPRNISQYEGQCHCSQTAWTAEIPEVRHVLCHCAACKLMGGGEFTLNQIIPKKNFTLTKGHLKAYSYKGDSGTICAPGACSAPPEALRALESPASPIPFLSTSRFQVWPG